MPISKNYSIKQIQVEGKRGTAEGAEWTQNLFEIHGPINYIKSIRISVPKEQKIKVILNNIPNNNEQGTTPYFIIGDRGFDLEVDEEVQLTNLNVDLLGFSGYAIIDLIVYDKIDKEKTTAVVYDGGEIGGQK